MVEVRMSYQEYRDLINQLQRENEALSSMESAKPIKKKKRVSAYQKELGRQVRKIREKVTLKNGKLRQGWNQSKIMVKAHKETKKILKR